MAPQRIYLIGAGVIAGFHAEALAHLPGGVKGCELIVTTRDPARLKAFLKKYPHARGVADAQAMLREPAQNTDIVIVTTPPAFHEEWTRRALLTNRHVLSEKPLAVSRKQGAAMVALAKKQKRLLADCAGRFLNLAINRAVKQQLDSGALGEMYLLTFVNRTPRGRPGIEYQPESPWFAQKKIAGGGILLDWGPYDFTHLIELYEPTRVEIVQAWAKTPVAAMKLPRGIKLDVEHHVGASLRLHLKNGRTLPVVYERAACTHGHERHIMELDGTKGSLTWDWTNWNDRTLTIRSDRQGKVAEKKQVFPVDPLGPHTKPLVYLHAAVHGAKRTRDVVTAGLAKGSAVNQAAQNRFAILCALYDAIADQQPRTVQL